jgi:4-hydroxy-3-polyprenylbenzoate decarboxylase
MQHRQRIVIGISGASGAILLPPMLCFYQRPQTTEDLVVHIAGRILSMFDIEQPGFQRWCA